MATHSSVLAWRIPGTGEPGGLPSMGSHRVGHDWSDLAAAAAGFFSSATSKPVASFRLSFLEKVPPFCLFSRLWIQAPASHLCPTCPTSQVQLLFPVKWSLRCLYFACDSFYIPPGFLPQALGWFSKHLSFLDTSCTPGETNLARFFRALVHELTCSLREGIQHKLVSCFTKFLFLSDNTYHRILSNGMVVSRISF